MKRLYVKPDGWQQFSVLERSEDNQYQYYLLTGYNLKIKHPVNIDVTGRAPRYLGLFGYGIRCRITFVDNPDRVVYGWILDRGGGELRWCR